MLGLGLEGRALVSDGELEEGMRRLDEATTVALARRGAAAVLRRLGLLLPDLRLRAGTGLRAGGPVVRAALATFAASTTSSCSTSAELTTPACSAGRAGGTRPRRQLNAAVGGLQASRPPMVGDALARLGELRRRQGRLDEAEKLFAAANRTPHVARPRRTRPRPRPGRRGGRACRSLPAAFPEPRRVERSAGLEVAIRAFAGWAS